MKVPIVSERSLQSAVIANRRAPQAIQEQDPTLFAECIKTMQHSANWAVCTQAFVFAYHSVHIECSHRGIAIPQTTDAVVTQLSIEQIEEGDRWEREIFHRIRLEQRLFHQVFNAWSYRTRHRPVVVYATSKMFRIFELLLQPL